MGSAETSSSGSGCCGGGASGGAQGRELVQVAAPAARTAGACCGSDAVPAGSAGAPDSVREVVQAAYAQVARGEGSCCGSSESADATALEIGYTQDDLAAVPEGANLGLGCGNPAALAELAPGEVVVDLGSGAGFDALLCARRVGPAGRVIGVDMTPEMLERARRNAEKVGARNVEYRRGLIEELPVEDAVADVVISNCVVNLSPDKPRVLREAFRVLKPGGRLRISDLATRRPLSDAVRADARAYVACVAGALTLDEYRTYLGQAGFVDVELQVARSRALADLVASDDPLVRAALDQAPDLAAEADNVVSVKVLARRPAAGA